MSLIYKVILLNSVLLFGGKAIGQMALSVDLSSSLSIKLCKSRSELNDSISLSILNDGADDISSLKIASYVNASLTGFHTWNGSLISQQSSNYKIPVQLNPSVDTSLVMIVTEKLNGGTQFEKDTVYVEVISGIGPPLSLPNVHQLCLGQSSQLEAASGYQSYQWSSGNTSRIQTVNSPGDYEIRVMDDFGCFHDDTVSVSYFDYPTSVLPSSIHYCENELGSIAVDSNYVNVQWSNGSSSDAISVSENGHYHVTVTDTNGCSYSGSTSLSVLQIPQSPLDNQVNSCKEDSLILDAGNHSLVIWQGVDTIRTYSPQTSGTYIVELINSEGCSVVDTVDVVINENPFVDISGSSVICNDSPISLTASGSNGSINWSTGESSNTIVVSSSGFYTVQVTDSNGCESTSEIQVTSESVTIQTSNDTILCDGDAINLKAITESQNSIVWSTGDLGEELQVSTSGIYEAIAQSNNCELRSTIVVEQRFAPSSEFEFDVVDNRVALTHLGNYGEYFRWDFGDSNYSNLENPEHFYTNIGDFTIELTTRNICGISSNRVTIQIGSLGINELSNNGELNIYPNPISGDFFTLDFNNWTGQTDYTLYNSVGQLVLSQSADIVGMARIDVPVNNLTRGTYILVVDIADQRVFEKLIID